MAEERRRPLHSRLKRAVRDIAPTIGAAIGGPLTGAAVEALSRAVLGDRSADDSDGRALEAALAAGRPEVFAAIRAADHEFWTALLEAGLEAERIAAGDRADARARHVAMRDITPAVLGVAIIAGFFGVLCLMFFHAVPQGHETEFSILLGALTTMAVAVVNFFFGSSVDSREKTQLMAGRAQPRVI